MGHTLVIVESPAKAKTIEKYLGPGFRVKASVGHVVDMPDRYGVDLTTFEEEYEVAEGKGATVASLRKEAKLADNILLASDPDREGEAIAWHLARLLKLSTSDANRVLFKEVTSRGVAAGVGAPSTIDMPMVEAQRARRVLDRIVGYDVSGEICQPAGARSAGRVQTPALHILCEREREIVNFKPVTYWTVSADYIEGFRAIVAKDVAAAVEDKEEDEGGDKDTVLREARRFTNEAEAVAVVAEAKKHAHSIRKVRQVTREKFPEKPYITSTCTMDAARKLKLPLTKATALLQSLFDLGLITYHRTDSTRVSPEGEAMAREYILQDKPSVLSAQAPVAKTKAGAQDAHEAIRPTHLGGEEGTPPAEARALYEMIKARFLSYQCRPATFNDTTVEVESGTVIWMADGSTLVERGYLEYWGPYASQSDTVLPVLSEGQPVSVKDYDVKKEKTSPPGRYDDAGLVKKLEASGIGRPSTFARTVENLKKRGYVTVMKGKGKLQPTDLGMKVDGLVQAALPDLVEVQYTKDMESALDDIAEGQLGRVDYLRDWHTGFRSAMDKSAPSVAAYMAKMGMVARERGGTPTDIICDRCAEGSYNKFVRDDGNTFLGCAKCAMTREVECQVRAAGCPECSGNVLERTSKDGRKYWACAWRGYKGDSRAACAHVAEGDNSTGVKCDRCDKGEYQVRGSKTAGTFWMCPDCGMARDVKAKVKKNSCPECNRHLIEKTSKAKKKFFSCVGYGDKIKPCTYIEKPQSEDTGRTCDRCAVGNYTKVTMTDGTEFLKCGACQFTCDPTSQRRDTACSRCGGVVLKRQGKNKQNFYWACVWRNYSGTEHVTCDYIESINEATGVSCDRCDGTYVQASSKAGPYYRCSKCSLTRDVKARVIAAGCPKCKSNLVEHKSKEKKIYFACARRGAAERPCDYIGGEPAGVCDRCHEGTYTKRKTAAGKDFLVCEGCSMMRDVSAGVKPGACPTCRSDLVERRSKDGKSYYACARRGAAERPCEYIEKAAGGAVREATEELCPKCEKHPLVIIKTASGDPFYACTDPERACSFKMTVGMKRRPEACPKCSGAVMEKRTRDKKSFWSCVNYPGCDYSDKMG